MSFQKNKNLVLKITKVLKMWNIGKYFYIKIILLNITRGVKPKVEKKL